MFSRAVILLFAAIFVVLIKVAWSRNKYDDYKGFKELDPRAPGAHEVQA